MNDEVIQKLLHMITLIRWAQYHTLFIHQPQFNVLHFFSTIIFELNIADFYP